MPVAQYNIPMTDALLRYRSEFPILNRTTYLISNSLGAMPRGVYDAMQGYADVWATRGVRAWLNSGRCSPPKSETKSAPS